MKTLLMTLVLTISASAMAGQSVLYSKTYEKNDSWELFRTQYKINPELGRAWFKVELSENTRFDDSSYEDVNVKTPGMSYNKITGDIVINGTVCATTKSSGRNIKIYPTGNCKVTGVENKIQVDDGFNIVTKKQLKIILTTR